MPHWQVQAVLLGERVTGNGAVQSLELSATGVPLWEIEPVLGIIVLVLCISAVWPSTVKTEEGKPKPGFFERIQNVSGRFACLGLASTITAEVITGKVWNYVTSLLQWLVQYHFLLRGCGATCGGSLGVVFLLGATARTYAFM